MAEHLGIGLIKYKKYLCVETPQLSERQKTVARYWNTAQRERVQFVDITEDQTVVGDKRLTLPIDQMLKQIRSEDNYQSHSCEVNHNRYSNQVPSNNLTTSDVDPPLPNHSCFVVNMESDLLNLDIAAFNNSIVANTYNKQRDQVKNRMKTTNFKGQKTCAGTLILVVFMAGLLLALVGTISTVQSRSRDHKLKTKLETGVNERPVILLNTKFKVPATNMFDEFSRGVTIFKVDRSEKETRIKFAKSDQ